MEVDYVVKPSVGQKLGTSLKNWRLLTFVGFFLVIFGSMGYMILSDTLITASMCAGGWPRSI